ncbi:hypothetical protein Esi_0013_0134 [Ectocarpus siliculosus]|uniref:Uncharacterized protein n=1 Tax=Ectocarpus siliculosus TaxID=2880 RepID=D8LEB9_ECTSI|nr:hypothetical protein Esi_0013_0134 [Ectocarpus siliculosus]|eukprot:CBN74204.1 hypothetical protein Esi_0013_0134 [Ectocarpus siliculosus]
MTKQANPRNKPKAEKAAKKKFTTRPRNRVPEADPIQEYWSRIISPRDGHVEVQFKGGGPGGVTVLRKDVPRLWRNVNNRKAKKRKGVPNFSVVDACFGFWFDVCKDDGLEYKFKSCANYFNDGTGRTTRQLAKEQEKSLLAALHTVSAIPKDSEEDSESDSGSVIDLRDTGSGSVVDLKKAAAGSSEQQKQHQEATEKNPTTIEVKSSICLARMPVFGTRCNMHRIGESRFCAEHRPKWHQKDSPIWGLLPVTMVPDSDPTICLAWVTSSGLRCSNKRYGLSRWCVKHFSEWHGKDSPAWRPCPP